MKDYSEFIQLIIEKSGIKKPGLIEKDIILHTILKGLYSDEHFAESYLFKGGTCLVKCYFGYYRFSVDLDFTFKNQEEWKELSKRSRRKALVEEAQVVGNLIESIAGYAGLEFDAELQNRRYIEFGSGSRMVTYKLYYPGGLIKVQVSLVENVLFEPKRLKAKTLLSGVPLSENDRRYFYDFIEDYSEVRVLAYDLREILVEKVRAILTRKVQKLRDFYDLYLMYRHGLRVSDYRDAVIKKTIPALRYGKYLENFRRNKASFDIRTGSILNGYELHLLNVEPDENFVSFFNFLVGDIAEILDEIEV